jgi:hypothetical protein
MAEYMHIGETPMRFRSVTLRSVRGEKRAEDMIGLTIMFGG